jgi:signal transduction histidine kinase
VIFTEGITRRKDAEQTRFRLEQQIAERSVAERQQLGRELHDGVGQQVTVIGMIAAALKDELAAAPSGTPDVGPTPDEE